MMAIPTPGGELKRIEPASSEQILSAVELELCARRAQRKSSRGTRTVLRVFGLLLLLGLLAAGLGALYYLQTMTLQPRPRPQPERPGVTIPAP